jgi:probable phosphoglycerate mutase
MINDSTTDNAAQPTGPAGNRPVHDRLADLSGTAQTAPPAVWSGAKGAPTRLILLRHGQTEYSGLRRYSGRGELPLTDIGVAQAKAAAHRLSTMEEITSVVCSPLLRARQSADAVVAQLGLPVAYWDALIETDFGTWEGLTFAEASERDPELHRAWLSDPSVPAPGGESFDQVHARVSKARDELVAAYQGCTVLVVSHVTPIKTVLRIGLDAGPAVLFRLHLDLASLSVVEFYPDGNASVRLVNDTAHLG